MQMKLSEMTFSWTGVDDDTPSGHVLAIGKDKLGNIRLFLFAGEVPTDEGFRGSVLVPPPESPRGQIAYGRSGTYVAHIASAGSTKALLNWLTTD